MFRYAQNVLISTLTTLLCGLWALHIIPVGPIINIIIAYGSDWIHTAKDRKEGLNRLDYDVLTFEIQVDHIYPRTSHKRSLKTRGGGN